MIAYLRLGAAAIFVLLLGVNSASAWHLGGYVRCDANRNGAVDDGDLLVAGVAVTVKGITDPTFQVTETTGADGLFQIRVPDTPASYVITIAGAAPILLPAPYPYQVSTTDAEPVPDYVTFLVEGGGCTQVGCWLTAGGAKFSSIIGIQVAEKGPQHNFGGNVNPGCSPTAGEGGQWNHVAHGLKLHFQGQAIQVVRCGNVPGLPPGSTSPATPYNFIEFEGTGVLKGVAGNKLPDTPVSFWGRAEDRNEPGSSGAKDGALIDRYYLRVWDGTNIVRLLVDNGAGEPVPITDGNLQIHVSSCSK